jgi:hydroxypyruvate isomerase
MAGKLPPNVPHERAHATYVSNLRFAAAALKDKGLNLLIEPINDRDMPGYFLTSSRQAAAIIEECGLENLFLQFDIYHMQRMEGDLANSLRSLLPLIRHIQIADVPGRHEPGTGEINYPTCSACSTSSATAAGSAANTIRAAIPAPGWAGATQGTGQARPPEAALHPYQ